MPRILSGEFKRHRLFSIEGDETRPMLSRVKESVFGMLQAWFEGARVLDLYAGIGTIGLEAVSRGASEVVMVELQPKAYKTLERNIARLGCGGRAHAVKADAIGPTALAAAPVPVDLVFCDPPYAHMKDVETRERIFEQLVRLRDRMTRPSYLVLRSPKGPDEIDLAIGGFNGPEPHRYRVDQWVLLYEPQ